jgi:hypothetical protein
MRKNKKRKMNILDSKCKRKLLYQEQEDVELHF